MPLPNKTRRWLKTLVLKGMSLYPPYIGAGIRVRRLAPGQFRVRMGLGWFNRNYYGSHYGGSLYSMCDPFFALALIEKLGPGYAVWDKRATIHFLNPGRGTVSAEFAIADERVEAIRRLADAEGRAVSTFEVEVVDERGKVVARVEKQVHVRLARGEEVATVSPSPARG